MVLIVWQRTENNNHFTLTLASSLRHQSLSVGPLCIASSFCLCFTFKMHLKLSTSLGSYSRISNSKCLFRRDSIPSSSSPRLIVLMILCSFLDLPQSFFFMDNSVESRIELTKLMEFMPSKYDDSHN